MGFSLHVYPTAPLLIILLSLLYACSLTRWRVRSRGRPFPPGPPPLPVIGNLFNTPGDKAWCVFQDLVAQYGDIVHVRTLGQSTIVLGNPEVISEYLEKRTSSTSDRPQTPIIDLLEQRTNFGLMPYGQEWRRYRRHFWQHFTSRAVERYQPITRAAAHQFLARLVERPSQFKSHVRHTFLASVLKIVYGIGLTDDHDEYAATFDVSAEGLRQGLVPGKYRIVEMFPFLRGLPKWVPGFAFQADLDRWRAAVNDVKDIPFAHTREAMTRGEGFDSIVAKTLSVGGNADEPEEKYEEMVKGIGLTSYEADLDLQSAIALQAFFLAMSRNPDVQKKAQAELDAVVGPGRLPEFSDLDSLAYVNAVIKETLRWHTVAPLGLAHATTCDDELRGYFIPAGTVVLANIWACMHDPALYDDPYAFRPERFIRDGKPDRSALDPIPFVFGFGRRICPGRHFALASLFIHVASVLHAFDITPPLDDNGRPIAVTHSQSTGIASYPEDCRCTIKPRSGEVAALIMAHASAVA
ncbi:cytochrome P450 [Ganoderma sinense ZZ0214-1]|uniref:Cytochrome P450 n=1 Tax=Ganoderma sinense ZZ0214-1 TaxID=1077348 RepID=A0A2G8S5R4_9APHY|nr:cytochrome P450 [Ganoderma sinense ZZ0214-1]